MLLVATLEGIGVLRGSNDLAAALNGETAAAISVAFSLMPIEAFTLEVDIAMTALVRCALAPNASAALVLAQIVGLTEFEHGLAIELASSWLPTAGIMRPTGGSLLRRVRSCSRLSPNAMVMDSAHEGPGVFGPASRTAAEQANHDRLRTAKRPSRSDPPIQIHCSAAHSRTRVLAHSVTATLKRVCEPVPHVRRWIERLGCRPQRGPGDSGGTTDAHNPVLT